MKKLDFGKFFDTLKKLDFRKLLSDYGNVLVLLILCAVMSVATLKEQPATSPAAAKKLAAQVLSDSEKGAKVMVIIRTKRVKGINILAITINDNSTRILSNDLKYDSI